MNDPKDSRASNLLIKSNIITLNFDNEFHQVETYESGFILQTSLRKFRLLRRNEKLSENLLSLLRWRFLSYKKQSINLLVSMDWFLYNMNLRHERVHDHVTVRQNG